MADTRAERIVRVDAAIALCRANRDRAEDNCHDGEEQFWERRIDTLLALRDRIDQRVPVTVTEEP